MSDRVRQVHHLDCTGGGRIARIQADATAPSRNEAGLNPKIAELADWHLSEAGAIAVEKAPVTIMGSDQYGDTVPAWWLKGAES